MMRQVNDTREKKKFLNKYQKKQVQARKLEGNRGVLCVLCKCIHNTCLVSGRGDDYDLVIAARILNLGCFGKITIYFTF